MNWLRVTLRMRGPTATPWQADTIWGHLAWGLLYTRGEGALRDFLSAYRGGEPPLLVSDGFPGDLLPRPIVPMVLGTRGDVRAEARALEAAREARLPGYVTPADFDRALEGETVPLARSETDQEDGRRVVLKNAVNRSLGTAAEGALYSIEEFFWPEVTIYVLVEDHFADTAGGLFEYMGLEGYGKRRSTGYGAARSVAVDSFDGFAAPAGANGFVSLSAFVPAAADPIKGSWRVSVKHGRLGEHYAYGPNPFKRPLVMLGAGSTFYDDSPRRFYGRLVEGVSPAQPEVAHYGFALAVPMRLP